MPLVIYEPVEDGVRAHPETDLIRFQDAPQVGGTIAIGGERRWLIMEMETYQSGDKTVYLAFITPEGADMPNRAEWTRTVMREDYPDISFDVQLWQKTILANGWGMDGKAPTGRLYQWKQIGDSDQAEKKARPWAVDIIETYKPIGKASYTGVHLCHCVPVSLPELAVA